MTSIVRPWCAQWIAVARGPKHLTNESLTSDGLLTIGMVRSLYVAWELGDEELFTQRLEDLSLRTRMDSEGRLSYTALGRNQKAVILNDNDYLGPQDALDTICAIREALLEKLITPVHEDLDARIKANPYCKVSDTSYTRMLCDAATIGGIHQHMLKTRGSILTKSASEIEDSVVEPASWLFPMMSKIPTVHGGSSHSDHAPKWECSPARKYKMLCSTIQDDIPTVVASFIKPNHREYMAAQRAKTGLVMEDEISMRRYWSWISS
ncbi:hypothetical protein N0V85_000798 [Neurospora sp. IMI 360204]|nr:hypothetical protein N0V85_000798 [Neurospora sp. IMI 360204]